MLKAYLKRSKLLADSPVTLFHPDRHQAEKKQRYMFRHTDFYRTALKLMLKKDYKSATLQVSQQCLLKHNQNSVGASSSSSTDKSDKFLVLTLYYAIKQ